MKLFKRTICILLALAMLLGAMPVFALDNEFESSDLVKEPDPVLEVSDLTIDDRINYGYHDVPDKAIFREPVPGEISANRGTYPSSYSSVTEGNVTTAKDQDPYGTCWAFSATTACESSLYMYQKTHGFAVSKPTDLSVLQLVNFFYNDKIDPLGNATGDKTVNGDETKLEQGGNNNFTMWGLASWTNGAPDSVLPYTPENCDKVDAGTLEKSFAYDYDIAHLQNVDKLPYNPNDTTSMNDIKEAIMNYGSVCCSYGHDSKYYSSTYGSYYTTESGTNHAVNIVGWNDNYPASNFGTTKPTKPGAFLVKNSWGTDWGTDGDADPKKSRKEGYFWLSYYDASLVGSANVFSYQFEPKDNYQYNYQYDGSCGSRSQNLGSTYNAAAIYTVKGLTSDFERIDAVGVGIETQNITGKIYIYEDPDEGRPKSGNLVATQNFSIKHNGYHTIKIDNAPIIEKGHRFSVIVDPDQSTCSMYIDKTYDNGSWIKFTNDMSHDKTYLVSPSGNTVYDCKTTYNGTFRIKAFTNDYFNGETYDVTYNANGGSGAPSAQKKMEGRDLTLSTTIPTRLGYAFEGWAISQEDADSGIVSYVPGSIYTADADLTLYAVWKTVYTVTYKNGNTTISTVTFGALGSIQIAGSTTKNFKGWSSTSGSSEINYLQGDIYSDPKDITLSVVANTGLITYDANGGTCSVRGTAYAKGNNSGMEVTLTTAVPVREGYEFLGWGTTKDATQRYASGAKYKVGKSTGVTLYAVWKEVGYVVTYDANGGSGAPENGVKLFTEDYTISSTIPYRAHYRFVGWTDSKDHASKGMADYYPGGKYTNNAAVTLIAVWEALPYSISYDASHYFINPAGTTGTYNFVLRQINANGKVTNIVYKQVDFSNESTLTGTYTGVAPEFYLVDSSWIPQKISIIDLLEPEQ